MDNGIKARQFTFAHAHEKFSERREQNGAD
nr:MAG TPA: hypothetical protein [Caudoviricetes sp.]DAZ50968.1 MAG TPA: hypothetical protein [Caudoviricetes sp.]